MTAAAFIVSQNIPSEVELSPIVTKLIHYHDQKNFYEKEYLTFCTSWKPLRAPKALAIWPAVHEMSEETL